MALICSNAFWHVSFQINSKSTGLHQLKNWDKTSYYIPPFPEILSVLSYLAVLEILELHPPLQEQVSSGHNYNMTYNVGTFQLHGKFLFLQDLELNLHLTITQTMLENATNVLQRYHYAHALTSSMYPSLSFRSQIKDYSFFKESQVHSSCKKA